jgi:hypothetical protein
LEEGWHHFESRAFEESGDFSRLNQLSRLHPARAKSDPLAAHAAIERFVLASRQPVLFEPGDDPLTITSATFSLTARGSIVTIECWNDSKNLVRRVRGIRSERRGRLEIEIERFGALAGTLTFLDLADPSNRDADRKGARLKYRERFRHSLQRQFAGHRIAELSTEQDLQHTLSPSFPRALLRRGTSGIAAIGASEDALSPNDALSFGLIWLEHLRHREPKLQINTLAIFLPAGLEAATCHRIRYLDPSAAQYLVFAHCANDEAQIDPRDFQNLDTRLPIAMRPLPEASSRTLEWIDRLTALEGVERRDRPDGSVSLAVRGLEFARASGDELLFGFDRKHVAGTESHIMEAERIAQELARLRSYQANDRVNPLYLRHPEAWLESQVRAAIETLDAMIYPRPLYGQVPQFAAGERGIIDLLGVDRDGRLAVLELKADQDIHLPLQALDYWMRVKWHLDRGEFSARGYFPGIALTNATPRLLLVAPSIEYHPSNETILKYFSDQVPVERAGVGLEWRKELRVMFRFRSSSWPSLSSARSREHSPA